MGSNNSVEILKGIFMLEVQLLNPATIKKIKSFPKINLEIPALKKIISPSEIKIKVKELENFIKYLETGNFAPETLARFNNLEQASEEINSNPELKILYKEYIEKEFSKAQKAYFIR